MANKISYTTLSPEVVCKKNAVIVNIVSSDGEWIDILNEHVPEFAKQEYFRWYAEREEESIYEPMWVMSAVQFVDLGRGMNVANCIALGGNDIFVNELHEALQHIFDFASKFESSIVIPRLGYGLTKKVIDDFVKKLLLEDDLEIWICDHPSEQDPDCNYVKSF